MPYTHERYPADIHSPSAEPASEMNDVLRAIGGPEADQQARFMDAVEKTLQETPDAYEQQLITMSADAHCWYLWGKHGQPLPQSLRLRTSIDGYGPAVDYRFPYSADIESRILEKLGPNGAYGVINEIDLNRGERYQSDLSPSLLRYTQSQVGLETLCSITYGVQQGERETTLPEQAAVRHQVHTEYGIDVHDSKTGVVYPQHGTPYFDTPRWRSAQNVYHRRTFMAGTEARPQDLEGHLLSTVRQGFETWITSNTANPNATTIIMQAQEAAATAPSHSDAEQSLADLLGNIFDAKKTAPAMPGAREVFIRLGSELLTKNQFMTPDAHGSLTVPATWDQLLDQSLLRLSTSGPGFVGGALNIRHYSNDGQFLATLRQPQAPLEAYKVESGMVEVPLPATPKPQLGTPLRYTPGSVTFEPHDYVESQKNVTVGNAHILRPTQIPTTPRVIFEDPHYSTEALEKHRDMPHDTADVVLVFEKDALANNAAPSMKGFELISIVGDGAGSEQYYFQYAPKKDPYQSSSRALGSYIAGNIAKQLYDIGLDDMARAVYEQADTLSPHSLANIVKAYSIASYPLGEEGKPNHALIAQVQSIDDLKKFAVGKLFIGQASSTTTLLNYLLPYSSFPTSKLEGYLWRPGESTIDATRHQHLVYGQYNSTHNSMVLDVEPTPTPDLEIIDPPRNPLQRPEIVVRQEGTGSDIDFEDTSTERVNLSSKESFVEEIRQTYGTIIMLNKHEATNRARLLGFTGAQPRDGEDEHADLAIFMERPVADTKEPVLYGYTLTAFDRKQNRAYFRYDTGKDYYENDFPIEADKTSILADGARKAGLFKLEQALQNISHGFSIRQLEKLVGAHTEYTFPNVAQNETEFYTITSLQDFCSFITNQGVLGVQCTSTAQFSKLLLQYAYPDMEVEAICGYLTPPISGRIKNVGHRTLLCKPKGGKPFIFDPSPRVSDELLAEISDPQPAPTETLFDHTPSQAAEDAIFDVANSFHSETTTSPSKEPKRHFKNGRQALLERAKDNFESLDEADIIVAIELARQALFARELNVSAAEAHAEKSTTEFDVTNSILRNIAGDFQSPQHQHRQQYWAAETVNNLQRRARALNMRDRLRVNEATSVLRLMRLAALQEQEKNS